MTEISSGMLLLTAIIAGAFVGTIADYNDYEDCYYYNVQSCLDEGWLHTMCQYPSPEPASRCGEWKIMGLTDAQKQAIVDRHNYHRRNVAEGKETRGNPGPQPPAAYMPDLIWNDELATIAQRWANQCILKHDKDGLGCHYIESGQVGQNIAMRGRNELENMVDAWVDEVNNFDPVHLSDMPDGNENPELLKLIGHYTQVVWGDTKEIGCGHICYQDPSYPECLSYLVCNYYPRGNWYHGVIYQTQE